MLTLSSNNYTIDNVFQPDFDSEATLAFTDSPLMRWPSDSSAPFKPDLVKNQPSQLDMAINNWYFSFPDLQLDSKAQFDHPLPIKQEPVIKHEPALSPREPTNQFSKPTAGGVLQPLQPLSNSPTTSSDEESVKFTTGVTTQLSRKEKRKILNKKRRDRMSECFTSIRDLCGLPAKTNTVDTLLSSIEKLKELEAYKVRCAQLEARNAQLQRQINTTMTTSVPYSAHNAVVSRKRMIDAHSDEIFNLDGPSLKRQRFAPSLRGVLLARN